jgi:hypothetical protein
VPRLEAGDHAGPERLAEEDRAVEGMAEVLHRTYRRVGVGRQSLLAGTAGVAAVAAVVEQQHGKPPVGEAAGEAGPSGPVAAVARGHQHGHPGVARGVGRQVPRAQLEAVGGLQRDVASAREHLAGGWYVARVGEVDQLPLQSPQGSEGQPGHEHHDGERHEDPPAGTACHRVTAR